MKTGSYVAEFLCGKKVTSDTLAFACSACGARFTAEWPVTLKMDAAGRVTRA